MAKVPKCRTKIAENFNHLSREDERYKRQTTDRQTDGHATAYSERERKLQLTNYVEYAHLYTDAHSC